MQFSKPLLAKRHRDPPKEKTACPNFLEQGTGAQRNAHRGLGWHHYGPWAWTRAPGPRTICHPQPPSHLTCPCQLPSGRGTALIQGPEDLPGPPRGARPGLPPAPPCALPELGKSDGSQPSTGFTAPGAEESAPSSPPARQAVLPSRLGCCEANPTKKWRCQ